MEEYNKYLRFPTVMCQSITNSLIFLVDRAVKGVQSWKMNKLSKVGKEVTLKVVAEVISTNVMSILLPLKNVCYQLEKII